MGSWEKREGEVAMTHRCSTGYPPYRSSIFFLTLWRCQYPCSHKQGKVVKGDGMKNRLNPRKICPLNSCAQNVRKCGECAYHYVSCMVRPQPGEGDARIIPLAIQDPDQPKPQIKIRSRTFLEQKSLLVSQLSHFNL